ncbi:MAG: phosphocholine cytidylyltransferase family protein [Candidatus Saccharicenans sp.]|uniref:phosphocholine cytidylyltransferase family protein n=1 Tax=Candidatus Saccharicenans sp. TaxID=2819258 RepID=UPI00404A6158
MKAIILAAGRGTRLGMDLPKAMVEINSGRAIIDYQVENLKPFIPVQNILLVVGFKQELIRARHPELHYVVNERFAVTNTSKSLLKGLNRLDEDVLWLNGDVIFERELIPKMLSAGCSCVLVDNKRCGPEEVKYRVDDKGYITEISKQVEKAEGEALGVNLVSRADLEPFRRHLELVADSDYFEKAIENYIIQDKGRFRAVPADGLFCHEVDFPEDLARVRAYLATAAGK